MTIRFRCSRPAFFGRRGDAAVDGGPALGGGGSPGALPSRSARSLAHRPYDRRHDPGPGVCDLLRLRGRRRPRRAALDPAFKLACGRLPDSGRDLCSQPTLSRLENAPGLKDVIRLTYALVDQWMASYAMPPSRITLDIDDTCDVAHGHQQLSLFNAHYDERANPSRAPTCMRQSLRSQRRRGNTGRTSCRRTPR